MHPTTMIKQRNLFKTCFLIIIFTGFILRIHHLDYESLWMDEIRQVSYYTHSFKQIIYDAASQNQPPLDYWVGHIFFFFSRSDFSARLPASLLGTFSLAMIMLLLRNHYPWYVAIGSGTILALLPFHIYFSQEARPYSIAIFMFILIVYYVDRIFTYPELSIKNFVLFTTLFTSYLYSRTLSPAVVLIALIPGCILLQILNNLIPSRKKPLYHGVILIFCTVLISFIFYLPIMHLTMKKIRRYSEIGELPIIQVILKGITHFDISSVYKSYITQLDPLGLILLPFLILGITHSLYSWRKNRLSFLVSIILPLALVLEILIYSATSKSPYRPCYPTYLLPAVLILVAHAFTVLFNTRDVKFTVAISLIIIFLGMCLYTGYAAYSFKNARIKTDWRGLTRYLANRYDKNHLIIFDSLSYFGIWEPSFYGFPRYYMGNSPLIPVSELPLAVSKLEHSKMVPVFVLFHWRNYYLTPWSKYPILAPSPKTSSINPETMKSSNYMTKNFTGFTVIVPKHETPQTLTSIDSLLSWVLMLLPQDASTVELHLAMASVKGALKDGSMFYHLGKSRELAPSGTKNKVNRICQYIIKSNR